MSKVVLKTENLGISFGGLKAVQNLNLEIKEGEIHVLMGPNGIGKSTLTKVIMGDPNYIVESGSIKYNDEDLLSLPVNERSKRGIYLVSQNPRGGFPGQE